MPAYFIYHYIYIIFAAEEALKNGRAILTM